MSADELPRPTPRAVRAVQRAICALAGHRPEQGRNGWENLGTGWFCARCSAMVTAAGAFYDYPAAVAAEARRRRAAPKK